MSHRFTIGVEEEFQIVDPASGELRSHVSELMEASSPGLGEQVKREMHQSNAVGDYRKHPRLETGWSPPRLPSQFEYEFWRGRPVFLFTA